MLKGLVKVRMLVVELKVQPPIVLEAVTVNVKEQAVSAGNTIVVGKVINTLELVGMAC